MNNTLLLIVGASGTGKTTIANLLSKYWGYKQLESYTTRPPRYDGEKGHIFLSDEAFDRIDPDDMVAYTEICGHRYCATSDQVDESDIYIVDLDGLEELYRKYRGEKRLKVVYLYTSRSNRFTRMLNRGDSVIDAATRLEADDEAFARDKADDILMLFDKRDVLRFMPNDKYKAVEEIHNFINSDTAARSAKFKGRDEMIKDIMNFIK